MENWLATPVIILAIIAAGGIVFKVGSWKGGVDSDRSSFKDFIQEIRDDIKAIFDRLPPAPVTGSSPLQLTDFGVGMAKQFQADKWADDVSSALMVKIDNKKPFEIDQFCQRYVRDELKSNPEFKLRVQECAYEKGTDEKDVLKVLGVVLRENLLNRIDSQSLTPPDPDI